MLKTVIKQDSKPEKPKNKNASEMIKIWKELEKYIQSLHQFEQDRRIVLQTWIKMLVSHDYYIYQSNNLVKKREEWKDKTVI